jgi:hypothetical protein
MSIKILNDSVALKPLIFDHDKGSQNKTVAGFVGTDKLLKTLITTEVMFTSKTFKAGQRVYLRADVYNVPSVKMIMKIDNQEFIILPEAMILAVEEI